MCGLPNRHKNEETHTYKSIGYSGIVWLVYLDSYVKSYLNLTLVVKSQKLYR